MPVKAKIKATAIAAALAMLPTSMFAAGLGKLTVLSGLGQPLNAEIELITSPSDDVSNFTVRLASVDSFKDAKIEFPSYLTGAKFTIEKKANKAFIRVSTSQPVNEPFVDMLLELGWPSGKMVKEFTALLDPADYASPTAAPTLTATEFVALPKSKAAKTSKKKRVTPPANLASDVPVEQVAKKPKASEQAPTEEKPKEAAKPASEESGADSYKVKRGDTLAEIASENKAAGVNLDQMLLAIYKANPNAFDRNNMNQLKVGAILKLPDASAANATSAPRAREEVQAQAADWQAYKMKLAGVVADKTEPTTAASSKATGKITPKVEDKSAQKSAATKDVVKLSQSELGATAKDGSQVKNLQKQIDALQDEALAKDKSAKESGSRIAELEKMNKQLKELLEMKNSTAAKVEKTAEAQAKKATEQPASKVESPASKVAEAVASKAESHETPASSEVAASTAVPKPAKKKPLFIAEPVEPEVSPVDMLLENLPLVGGGAGAIALLGGLLVWRRRRSTAFADSIITGSDLRANTNIGSTGGAIINTGATENSFLTDFSREGLGAIDTDEVDPIAEAEVYLAYGRDPQAEEILKDALVKDPARQEVRLKLMEIYFNRKDADNFELHAKELHSLTQAQGQNWVRAAEMGRAIDPNNGLYGDALPVAASVADSEPDHLDPFADMLAANAGEPKADELLDFSGAVSELDAALDASPELSMDLTQDDIPAVSEPAVDDKVMLDFDLGAFDGASTEEALPVVDEPAAEDDNMLSFDALDMLSATEEEPENEDELQMEDLGGAEINLDDELTDAAEEVNSDSADGNLLDFDFDLGSDADALSTSPAESMVEEQTSPTSEKSDDEPSFDFSFDGFDASEVSEEVTQAVSSAADDTADLDLDSISLDMDTSFDAELPSFDEAPADDPVSTKLDLAKAYVEMGDHEGAKEILEEVVSEGSAAQQDEARLIISTLG